MPAFIADLHAHYNRQDTLSRPEGPRLNQARIERQRCLATSILNDHVYLWERLVLYVVITRNDLTDSHNQPQHAMCVTQS